MNALRSTAILLEEMSNAGVFEKLALACVRRLAPEECGAVIHEGLNAEGKPVAAPLDGFVQVPGRIPPFFVGVSCTTEATAKLHVKWLGHSRRPRPRKPKRAAAVNEKVRTAPVIDPAADLPKAIAAARELRTAIPEANFKIFLLTNRPVGQELQMAVATTLHLEDITHEIVERSRLAEFLDTIAEGQFLREVFLGVPTTTLSRGMLFQCGRQLFEHRWHAPDLQTARNVIPRDFDAAFRESWNSVETAVVWLTGETGKGKSVAACSQLKAHYGEGGLVLWITEADVAGAVTLAEALFRAVTRVRPSLRCDDVEDLLRIPEPTQRLLVLIDDLNRSDDPAREFSKVRAWAARLSGEGGTETFIEPSTVLLCPVWPRHRRHVTNTNGQPPVWEQVVEVGDFSSGEQVAFETHADLDSAHRSAIRAVAGNDPYLTGWLARTPLKQRLGASVAWLIDQQIAQVADRSGGFRGAELTSAMLALGAWMLESRHLRPAWTEVTKQFFSTEHLQPLRTLIADGYVLFESDNRLSFAHDRLREVWLARALAQVSSVQAICEEVNYAELVGQAIADNTLTSSQLDQVARKNPLALFVAWERLNPHALPDQRTGLISRIREWLRWRNGRYDDTEWLHWEIARKLQGIDDPEVLELAKQLRPTHTLWLAGIRNGSANAARCYLQSVSRVYFPPACPDAQLVSTLGTALERKHDIFLADLRRGLEDVNASVEAKEAWIIVAGYVGRPECTPWIAEAWKRAPAVEQREWIAAMLWSSSRCQPSSAIPLWEDVCAVWQSLSAEKDAVTSPRQSVAQYQLNMCRESWLATELVAWIKDRIQTAHPLRSEFSSILHAADHPDAIEFKTREEANHVRANGGRRRTWFTLKRSMDDRRGKRLTAASRARLRAIWDSTGESDADRGVAFALWLPGSDSGDLPALRALPADSPLQEQALPRRMALRDLSCVPLVLRSLPNELSWISMVSGVWTKQFLPVVSGMLANYSSEPGSLWSHHLHELLIAIPPRDAEQLILAHEAKFCSDHSILQAAILTGTPQLQDWVRRAFAIEPKLVETTFDHIVLHVYMGRSYLPRWHSRSRWLRNLEPFLEWIPDKEKRRFLKERYSADAGWSYQHILPLLAPQEHAKFEKSEATLLEVISAVLNNADPSDHARQMVEQLQQHNWEEREILETVFGWAGQQQDEKSLAWLAAFIGELGNRQDVVRMNRLLPSGSVPSLASLALEAEFRVFRRVLS